MSTSTTANEWHHVALVWAEDTANSSFLYHDGVLEETFTGKDNSSHGNESSLGNIASNNRLQQKDGTGDEQLKYSDAENSSFDGIIDEFRLTNTALSAYIIKTMYNTENTGTWHPALNENVNNRNPVTN